MYHFFFLCTIFLEINPDTKSHYYECDIDGESRNLRQYTKLQIGQGHTSVYTKIKLPRGKTFDDGEIFLL